MIRTENLKFATKLGKFVKNNSTKTRALWDILWEQGVENLVKKENGRIYFILVEDEIVKIGCSECKGGMRSTFASYKAGLSGSPSLRTFGIAHLISEELEKNHKVEIYGMWNEPIKVMVKGIFEEHEEEIFPSIKSMEEKCRKDYKQVYNKYPIWNFQENHEQWAEHIQTLYKAQVQQRGKKKEVEKEVGVEV